jgi:hypothetical protein
MSLSYSRSRLVQAATLRVEDVAIIQECRQVHNRLGFAYQIGFVRLWNRFPAQCPLKIDEELLAFIAMQLGSEPDQIRDYASRQPTVSDHQTRIRKYLGLKPFGPREMAALEQFVFEESCRLEQTVALLARAETFLKEQQVLLPGDHALQRLVGEKRKLAREKISERIADSLSTEMKRGLEGLIAPTSGISALQKIKANPKRASPEAMRTLVEKLVLIEATEVLSVDLSWLSGNYQRTLFHYVRKSTAHRLRETVEPRRHAALVCFLHQSYRDSVDQAVDMYDKILTSVQTRSQHDLDEQMVKERHVVKASMTALRSVGSILLDDAIADKDLRESVFAELPKEQLTQVLAQIEQWVSGGKSDVFLVPPIAGADQGWEHRRAPRQTLWSIRRFLSAARALGTIASRVLSPNWPARRSSASSRRAQRTLSQSLRSFPQHDYDQRLCPSRRRRLASERGPCRGT